MCAYTKLGNIIVLLSNFIPSYNKSIILECFFTIGKEGRPNQSSILLPMRILGNCMRRYQNFANNHDAIVSNFDKVIVSNCTFFGRKKRLVLQVYWRYMCILQCTGKAKQSDHEEFLHEKLCEKITQDGGNYRVVLFCNHARDACANWFPAEKILNHGTIAHGSVIRNNWHREQARDEFLVTVWTGHRHSFPLQNRFHLSTLKNLHIGNDPNRDKSTSSKEKQLQRDPEGVREEEESTRRKEECARKKEERVREEEERAMRENKRGSERGRRRRARGGKNL